ncbi:MAG: hypothetical protein AABZ53_07470, partial [Planctomycetota bacterium]
ADFKDAMWGLNNYYGTRNRVKWFSPDASFPTTFYSNGANTETDSASAHAVNIMLEQSGRTDITHIEGWMATVRYSHLALQSYANVKIPSKAYVCPEDKMRLVWQKDPLNYNNLGEYSPVAPGATISNADKRWPYSSSYDCVTPMWTRDIGSSNHQAWFWYNPGFVTAQGSVNPAGDLCRRKWTDVAFPGSKVQLYDTSARHHTKGAFWAGYDDAKQPILFFDSSVRTMTTGDANKGWNYNNPTNNSATYAYTYTPPNMASPPLRNGSFSGTASFTQAYFFTTRGGLGGADFGASEVVWR